MPVVCRNSSTGCLLIVYQLFHLLLCTQGLLHQVYKGALGNPLLPNPEDMSHLSSDVLQRFSSQHITGPRTVVAASGISHHQLVDIAAPMFDMLSSDPGPPEPSSQYMGGYCHITGSFPQANLMLGFEFKGGWRDVQVPTAAHSVWMHVHACGSDTPTLPRLHSRPTCDHHSSWPQVWVAAMGFGVYCSCCCNGAT